MASSTAQVHGLAAVARFTSPNSTTNHPNPTLFFGLKLKSKASSNSISRCKSNPRLVAEKIVGIDLETTNSAVAPIEISAQSKDFAVPRRKAMALILSGFIFSQAGARNIASAQSVGFREYIDSFDGYSFKYPQNWIQVRGAGADIFFRDPFVLDENISVDISSPSSSNYKSVEDLGSPEEAGKNVLRQYLTEFMSTRLGVRRESSVLSTSSKVASDGKLYYEIEVNIKSYANNNELAVMPENRVARLEWDRRYLAVLGVENNRLYALRLQTPEKSFVEEESDLRDVMDSFRVNKILV